MTDKLKELVADIRELIEGYVDIKDGENGPLPNNAMRATQLLDELSAFLAEQAPAGEPALREAVLAVGHICADHKPEKPSVIYGHPSMKEWVNIFNLALAAGRSSQPVEPRDPAAK